MSWHCDIVLNWSVLASSKHAASLPADSKQTVTNSFIIAYPSDVEPIKYPLITALYTFYSLFLHFVSCIAQPLRLSLNHVQHHWRVKE
jgi:hypothetical protein